MSKYTNSTGLTKYVTIFYGIRTFVLGICICICIHICISNKAISENVLKLGLITMAHCIVLHPTFRTVYSRTLLISLHLINHIFN